MKKRYAILGISSGDAFCCAMKYYSLLGYGDFEERADNSGYFTGSFWPDNADWMFFYKVFVVEVI